MSLPLPPLHAHPPTLQGLSLPTFTQALSRLHRASSLPTSATAPKWMWVFSLQRPLPALPKTLLQWLTFRIWSLARSDAPFAPPLSLETWMLRSERLPVHLSESPLMMDRRLVERELSPVSRWVATRVTLQWATRPLFPNALLGQFLITPRLDREVMVLHV